MKHIKLFESESKTYTMEEILLALSDMDEKFKDEFLEKLSVDDDDKTKKFKQEIRKKFDKGHIGIISLNKSSGHTYPLNSGTLNSFKNKEDCLEYLLKNVDRFSTYKLLNREEYKEIRDRQEQGQ